MTLNPFLRNAPNPRRDTPRRVRDRERLHGDKKTARRQELFDRSGGQCEACLVCGTGPQSAQHDPENPDSHKFDRCLNRITWDTMQWSHNRHSARKSDSLDGGLASCKQSHGQAHNAGGKPVRRKPGRPMNRREAEAYWKSKVCFCERPKPAETSFCDSCKALLTEQLRYDVENTQGKDYIETVAECEKMLLVAKG
jgi:hypothetical protein